jgi:hypothetical protein
MAEEIVLFIIFGYEEDNPGPSRSIYGGISLSGVNRLNNCRYEISHQRRVDGVVNMTFDFSHLRTYEAIPIVAVAGATTVRVTGNNLLQAKVVD